MKKGPLRSYLCCHHIAEKLLQHFTCGLVFQHFTHYLVRCLHATVLVAVMANPFKILQHRQERAKEIYCDVFLPRNFRATPELGSPDWLPRFRVKISLVTECRLASVTKSRSKARARLQHFCSSLYTAR